MITEHDLKRKDLEIALLREVEKAARAVTNELGYTHITGRKRAALEDALGGVSHFDRNTETARRLGEELERMGVR